MNKTRTFRALGLTTLTTLAILNVAPQAKAQQNAPTVQVEPRRGGNFGGGEKIFDLPDGVDTLSAIDPFCGPLLRATPEDSAEAGAVEVQARQRPARRGRLEMPEGIASIVAIDAINSLLVQTTGEDAEEAVQTRASALEQPMRQVRFDVRVIEAPANALGNPKDFHPINGNDSNGDALKNLLNGGPFVSSVPGKLDELLQLGSAHILNTARVSTPNNMAAKLRWETSAPATVRSKNADGARIFQSAVLTDSLRLSLTPTLNRDGTVTIALDASSELKSEGDALLTGFTKPVLSAQQLNTISNVKAGDTLTVAGLHLNTAPNKKFSIVPFGTVVNVDAPVAAKDDTAPKQNQEEKELYIEITATLATPQTPDATK